MVVIRHGASGAAQFLAERIESNVINAGDGTHEHPTQGLLDLLTLRDHFGDARGAEGLHLRRRAALARRALEHLGTQEDGRRGRRLRAALAAAERDRRAGRHGLRPHRGSDRVGGRAQRPATAARAHAGRLHPVAARVQPRLRRDARATRPRAERDMLILHPGPDEPRRRDRLRRGRRSAQRDPRPGDERRGRFAWRCSICSRADGRSWPKRRRAGGGR